MGAIAARGDDTALQLFRSVLLASASIPGIFPPVLIDAEANGKKFQELHNDGTITAPFFIAPESVLAGNGTVHLPTKQIYVIANAKLHAAVRRDDAADRRRARPLDLAGAAVGVAGRALADAWRPRRSRASA